MTFNTELIQAELVDEIEGLPPSKTARYRCKLDTASDVKRELAKLYREARSGLIDPAEATKLGWLLGEVRKTIEVEQNTADIQANLDGSRLVIDKARELPVSIIEFV